MFFKCPEYLKDMQEDTVLRSSCTKVFIEIQWNVNRNGTKSADLGKVCNGGGGGGL